MALRGVIDSPDIPLNVSRSYLQMDKTVRQLSGHISKKVSDSLLNLYKNEKARYVECWNDMAIVVKLGILEDEKFYERIKDALIWKTVDGEWLSVQEYLDAYREKTKDKIYYTKDENQMKELHAMYKKQGIEVLCSNHPIDMYVMQFIERKLSNVTFQRVDAVVGDHILDNASEKDTTEESAKIKDFISAKLGQENVEVEAKSFSTNDLPGLIIQDENQRRMRDYMLSLNPKGGVSMMNAFGKTTFVVNTNNPLIDSIRKLENKHPELAEALVKETYDIALLSQKEMDPNALGEFISRTVQLLEKLTQEVVKDA
jgi:molecular chaperone HtpG